VCTAAAEEVDEDCEVKQVKQCNEAIEGTSDMLCTCERPPVPPNPTCAPFGQWPSVDNAVTCANCTALVEAYPFGGKCDSYCRSFGHVCVAAAEEVLDTCAVDYTASCDEEIQGTSDMLCTCRASTCDAQCEVNGDSHTCRARVEWLESQGLTLSDALQQVNGECGTQCSCSAGEFEMTVKVMSYNTQFSGYPSRVPQYGNKIREVGADVVGTQECQDRYALARASGYEYVSGTRPNPIFYKPGRVSLVAESGGQMRIPRDNYANRYITWAKFQYGSTQFWFFNTHLPHRHNEASDINTHARIAQMLLAKRNELDAGNMPTVITGDCNPFASNGAPMGSFESNLEAAGFEKSYQARGNPGFRGLDKIFASPHWRSSNGADQGTGSSDHPAIAVDLTLK